MKNNLLARLPLIGSYFRPRKPSPRARVYQGIHSERRRARIFYYPIRAFFRAISRTQHAEIRAIGLENIPPDGSVFLVGNHPNSFLDFFNLITVARHPIATAAKDTVTNIPVFGRLLKNYALLVPVSRAQDKTESGISEEERLKANEKMIRDAVELLVNGRLFNIYAEGASIDSRTLNRIKLGFMMLGIQAERQFNYNLNLRFVPYGYYYDRINKFRSSVCVIFGKPFKIRGLVELPEDVLSLPEKDQKALEKKILLAGKKRLQSDIENIIISIPNKEIIGLIDELTDIYVTSPFKYMGPYRNVREKYILCKNIAQAVQEAEKTKRGKEMIRRLRILLKEYRKKLDLFNIKDQEVRRQYAPAAAFANGIAFFRGLLLSPLIVYGYVTNFIPRLAGRITRYVSIDLQKRPQVDGDERTIVAAALGVILTYPALGILIYLGVASYLPALPELFSGFPEGKRLAAALAAHSGASAAGIALFGVYLMGRLWRVSVSLSDGFKDSLYFLRDFIVSRFRRKRLNEMRALRHEIIDQADFIMGDFL